MESLIQNILDLAKMKRVDYADIRIVRRQNEEIEVKNGKVEGFTHDEDFGFGIRVLFQGAWGFACSSRIHKREIENVLGRAIKIAKAGQSVKGRDVFFPLAFPIVDQYRNPISI